MSRTRVIIRFAWRQLKKALKINLGDLIRLTRFPNLLIIVLTQYFTALFLIDQEGTWQQTLLNKNLFLLVFSTVLIAAAGYIINDYYDVKIDFINKPDRVLIGRKIRRRIALALHLLFNAVALMVGVYLDWKIAAIHFISIFLLWLYSNQLKRMPFIGNFTVGLLTGAAILIISLYYQQNFKLVLPYAVFAFAMTLIREIIKDLEDLKGDANFGCRTLPVIWGIRKTKLVLYILLIIFMITLAVFSYLADNMTLNLYFAILAIPMIYFVAKLVRADSKRKFGYLSNYCKVIMLSGVISMVFF